MPSRRVSVKKILIDDPNAVLQSTDDGEEIDNSESGGLTKSTFVIGGASEQKRVRATRAKLGSGAASAESVAAVSSAAEDDLLPLLPLPGQVPIAIEEEALTDDEDDLLALVAEDAEKAAPEGDSDEGELFEEEAPTPKKPRRAKPKANTPPDAELTLAAEMGYRFPYSKTVLEILPDMPGTFCIRMAYSRGKAMLPVFQSTPFRSVAEIRCRGQHFPVFLLQHGRKKRDRVLLGAKRKAGTTPRCAVRCAAVVTGKRDRFTWFWRVTATAAALTQPIPKENGDRPTEAIRLTLPFAAGRLRVLTLPGAEGRGLVALVNDVAVSVIAQAENGVLPTVTTDDNGIYVTREGVDLSGSGTTLTWETWFSPAKTDAEALTALARHLADAADRAQAPPADTRPFLGRVMETCERELMRNDIIEKRGADKNVYRIGPHRADALVVGPGTDAALTALTLLHRFHQTGDELLRRRARLLTNGLCEFQNNQEDSPHWGALWDALVRKTEWGDIDGKRTISFLTTARITKGLQLLQAHFKVDLYERTAAGAAQWLLLRLERDGLPQGERFGWDGKALIEANPWIAGEALLPLIETFRATKNEVYLKNALRTVTTLQERVADASLTFTTASTEQLAAMIEGILLVSREYEQEDLVAFARTIGDALRSRRLPDGSVSDPTGLAAPVQEDLPLLASTLAGARAALTLTRVDKAALWPVFALRAVRAADNMVRRYSGYLNVADRSNLLRQSLGVLLGIATRAKDAIADPDRITVTRGWQTFAPDPATHEYIRVSLPGGDSPDYLSLVCPVTQQVLIVVLAPAGTETVEINKNNRRPYVKNLLNGDYDLRAALVPLDDGTEGNIGVFLADT